MLPIFCHLLKKCFATVNLCIVVNVVFLERGKITMNTPSQELPQMRVTTPVPDMGSGPIPVEPYISPEFFEQEREKIFKRAWLQVLRVEEIPLAGDYQLIDLPVLNTAVIVVRGQDNQVRAFHNICTHRGNSVTLQEKGNARTFVCGYHGWVFNLDGSLRARPGEEYFSDDTGKCDLGLLPLACDVWNGFVFINYQPEPAVGLPDFLGEIGRDMEGFPFGELSHIARYRARVKVNWKAFTDAFREGYHVAMVHGQSIPDSMNSPTNPQGVPVSARLFGSHYSMSTWANPEHQPTPSEALAWKLGMTFSPGEQLDLGGVNPSGDDIWWFDMNMVFPNFFAALGPGWVFTYHFWPRSVDETDWTMNIYQMEAEDYGQRIAQEHTKVLLRDLLYEDLSTLESTQKGMSSGVLKQLHISDGLELAVRQQQWVVQQWVNGDGDPGQI